MGSGADADVRCVDSERCARDLDADDRLAPSETGDRARRAEPSPPLETVWAFDFGGGSLTTGSGADPMMISPSL